MPISPERSAQMKKQREDSYARRKSLLSSFPCICCGDPDDTVIQWHHVCPEEKIFSLFDRLHKENDWWEEVLKCVPVCANCHIKIHKNKLCLIPPRLR